MTADMLMLYATKSQSFSVLSCCQAGYFFNQMFSIGQEKYECAQVQMSRKAQNIHNVFPAEADALENFTSRIQFSHGISLQNSLNEGNSRFRLKV
jgi:hypothetical protein